MVIMDCARASEFGNSLTSTDETKAGAICPPSLSSCPKHNYCRLFFTMIYAGQPTNWLHLTGCFSIVFIPAPNNWSIVNPHSIWTGLQFDCNWSSALQATAVSIEILLSLKKDALSFSCFRASLLCSFPSMNQVRLGVPFLMTCSKYYSHLLTPSVTSI